MSTERIWVGARLESASFSCEHVEIRELTGREAISEPFAFDVEVVVPDSVNFEAHAALGKDVSIVIDLDKEEVRRIHGLVCDAADGLDPQAGFTTHRLRIVPRVHRLTLNHACEVFLDKSVVDIARELLGRVGLGPTDVADRLLRAPPEADAFRLQYAETDFAFVSRLLERAGIAYTFDHASGKDVLVLSDENKAFPAAVGPSAIPYVGRRAAQAGGRGIADLVATSAMLTARHVVHDYDPDHPTLDLRSEHVLGVPFGGEIVDFCAGHATPQDGREIATMRAHARLAVRHGLEGEADVPYIEAGRTIAIEGHPRLGPHRWLVVSVEHRFTQPTLMHIEAGEQPGYQNKFRVVRADRDYRPELRTPWPRIVGFVHAVTDVQPPGASNRIAQLDEQGRYTIHFLFDRAHRAGPPRCSARVRMMQPHAGPGYGMHFPLKPGIEVLVAFIEGDPDRPVIAGSVPHPLTVSPVTQENARMNRIQTESGIHITMKDS
jgi:type VI secretion system secreted protein VgrG